MQLPEHIKLTPVSMMLIEKVRLAAQQKVEVFPKPFYMVELADGTKVAYEHDEKSLETEEEKAAWQKYIDSVEEQRRVSSTEVMNFLLASGVTVDEQILLQGSWRALQEYFHVPIPDNPIEAQIHYLQTVVMRTPDEIQELIGTIMEASGISKDLLTAARATFQRKLRQETDTLSRIGGEIQPTPTGEMVHESQIQ